MKIYIINHGWCLLGRPVETTDTEITIDNAYTIRRWGTNQGLGQLAKAGIRQRTTLDAQPSTTIQKSAIIFTIECSDIWTPDYITTELTRRGLS